MTNMWVKVESDRARTCCAAKPFGRCSCSAAAAAATAAKPLGSGGTTGPPGSRSAASQPGPAAASANGLGMSPFRAAASHSAGGGAGGSCATAGALAGDAGADRRCCAGLPGCCMLLDWRPSAGSREERCRLSAAMAALESRADAARSRASACSAIVSTCNRRRHDQVHGRIGGPMLCAPR